MSPRRRGTIEGGFPGRRHATVLSAMLAIFGGGCAAAPTGPLPTAGGPLLVFVASSLGDVVNELAAGFTAAGGARVDVSAASSILLGRQIEAGAPVDLFIAASEDPVVSLIRAGFAVPTDRVELLGNRLVAIVPASSTTHFARPSDLVDQAARLALGDPASVPAGRYARAALETAGVWESLQPGLVPAGSVRAALAYVETRVVDVGLVYATDARSSSRVRVAFVLASSPQTPIRYPAVIPTGAPHREEARRLLEYLQAPAAAAAFEAAGFEFLRGDAGAPGAR